MEQYKQQINSLKQMFKGREMIIHMASYDLRGFSIKSELIDAHVHPDLIRNLEL